MHVYRIFSLLLALSVAPILNCGGDDEDTTEISIPDDAESKGTEGYGENPLVISQGTTVKWTNDDEEAHTATSDTDIWDSGILEPGESFSYTFNDIGTFPYHCTIHGADDMSGIIQVN
jgi:plastocyanin